MRTSDLTDTHNRKGKAQQTSHFSFFEAHLANLIRIRPQLMQLSSLPFAVPPDSVHTTWISGPVGLRWFSPAHATQGVFSRSPSLVAVTQEVLLFHYPASSVSGWGLREYRCRIITGPSLYESMEHAANITPCNTLPRQHPHICP